MAGSGTNSDSPSAELAATEGQGNDALGGLSSRAESTDLETTPLDSITDEFAALGDKISEQADALSDKVGETIDSAAARLTSSGQDALDSLDDLLADGETPSGNAQNGEALGAASRGAGGGNDSFGVIALVAMMPLVALQAMNITAQTDPHAQRVEFVFEWPARGGRTKK